MHSFTFAMKPAEPSTNPFDGLRRIIWNLTSGFLIESSINARKWNRTEFGGKGKYDLQVIAKAVKIDIAQNRNSYVLGCNPVQSQSMAQAFIMWHSNSRMRAFELEELPHQNHDKKRANNFIAATRRLRDDERSLLESSVRNLPNADELLMSLSTALVQEMADGGMGSLHFSSNEKDRAFGDVLIEKEYLDSDGIPISVAVIVDSANRLYELDIWKTDFSRLKRFPRDGIDDCDSVAAGGGS